MTGFTGLTGLGGENGREDLAVENIENVESVERSFWPCRAGESSLLRKERKSAEEDGTEQTDRPARAESVADYTASRPLALLGFSRHSLSLGAKT